MSHCSLLKAIRPEWPTGVPPFLLFRGLWLQRLCSVSPFFPWLGFSRCLLSNASCCSLLKAARPERFPHRVSVGPSVPPSSSSESGQCSYITVVIRGTFFRGLGTTKLVSFLLHRGSKTTDKMWIIFVICGKCNSFFVCYTTYPQTQRLSATMGESTFSSLLLTHKIPTSIHAYSPWNCLRLRRWTLL
jgi:hypothetical protein